MTKEFLRTEAEVVPDLLVLNFIVDFGLFMRFVNINDNKKHLTKQDGAHWLTTTELCWLHLSLLFIVPVAELL